MLENKETPTRIVYIIEYEDGSSETITMSAKDLSNEELLKEAAAGQKAALYELKARIAKNSPEPDTDKI
jgi:hypothetical protein